MKWRTVELDYFVSYFPVSTFRLLLLGTAEAEITVLSFENPDLSKVLFFKSGVGQNVALHISLSVKISALLTVSFLFS